MNKILTVAAIALLAFAACTPEGHKDENNPVGPKPEPEVEEPVLKNYENMFLADVATKEELYSDVFGVPMSMDKVGDFKYEVSYFNTKENQEIYFLPQKNDFKPVCIGAAAEAGKLSALKDVKPIVLAEANVYYKITLDIKAMSYELSTYPIAEANNPMPMKFGEKMMLDTTRPEYTTDYVVGICYSAPNNIINMEQDKNNPNILFTELDLVANTDLAGEEGKPLNFIFHAFHDWGWWKASYWRCGSEEDPSVFYYASDSWFMNPEWKGKTVIDDIWSKSVIKKSGHYKLTFDTHTGRAKIVPAPAPKPAA